MSTEASRAAQIYERMLATLRREEQRDDTTLHLTANENVMSEHVQQILASNLAARYHLGTSAEHAGRSVVQQQNFVFNGLADLSELELLAADVFRRRLGGAATDFRPLSGLHCLICSVIALSRPADTVLSIHPDSGGHVATAELVRKTGRRSILVDFDHERLTLSLDHLTKLSQEHPINLAFLDEGAPLYPLPFAEIRRILGPDVTIVYDASHALGLLMGGVFGDPIADGCDVVQGNTHKTFPGPQKAVMHFAAPELAARAMATIGQSLVSSQHTHQAAALYFATLETDLFGAAYARQTVANARALSAALERRGFELLLHARRYTESHQVLVHLPDGLNAFDSCSRLSESGISVNAKRLYGHHVLRLGVQEITRRGLREADMQTVADLLDAALSRSDAASGLRARVARLRRTFAQIHYSFDALEPQPVAPASTTPTRLEWPRESTSR